MSDIPSDFIHPTPRTMRHVALVAALFTALMGSFGIWGQPALRAWMSNIMLSDDQRAQRVAIVMLAVVGLVIAITLALASTLGYLSWRIHRTGQFPPPGYPVWRKTRILTGQAARQQAHLHTGGCVLCLVLCATVLWMLFNRYPLPEVFSMLRG